MAEEFADIAEYAVRAERYVFDDPNTSLMKSRQFAEFLCNFVARRNGLDPADLNFQAVEQLLARQRLVSRPVRENFRQIRTWGNSASHAGFSERQIGLAALITAFDLAVWFFRTFVDDQFAPGPFRPPPNPVNIEEELRLELDVLRDELAQHQQQLETAQGESIEQDEIRHNLERESQARFRSLEEASNTLANTQASREQEQHEFEKQLATLRLTVEAVAQEDLQELAYRSRRAAEMIGLYGDYIEYVPLRQLRIRSGTESRCCQHAEILVRDADDDRVMRICSNCGQHKTLNFDMFCNLDIWVDCPRCRCRMKSVRVRVSSGDGFRYQFGFRCESCFWRCMLSSLLPDEQNLEIQAD